MPHVWKPPADRPSTMTQSLIETDPVTKLVSPTGHDLHAVDRVESSYVPGGHGVHSVPLLSRSSPLLVLYEPGKQKEKHLDWLVLLGCSVPVEGLQATQEHGALQGVEEQSQTSAKSTAQPEQGEKPSRLARPGLQGGNHGEARVPSDRQRAPVESPRRVQRHRLVGHEVLWPSCGRVFHPVVDPGSPRRHHGKCESGQVVAAVQERLRWIREACGHFHDHGHYADAIGRDPRHPGKVDRLVEDDALTGERDQTGGRIPPIDGVVDAAERGGDGEVDREFGVVDVGRVLHHPVECRHKELRGRDVEAKHLRYGLTVQQPVTSRVGGDIVLHSRIRQHQRARVQRRSQRPLVGVAKPPLHLWLRADPSSKASPYVCRTATG
eukprot:750733-Hanusia_phi.AAC.8